MRDAFLKDVPFHPDRQYDPTFISLLEVDYNDEDIADPDDPSTWGTEDL